MMSLVGFLLQVSLGGLLMMWLVLQCSVMCCRSVGEEKVVVLPVGVRVVVGSPVVGVVSLIDRRVVVLTLLLCLGVLLHCTGSPS